MCAVIQLLRRIQSAVYLCKIAVNFDDDSIHMPSPPRTLGTMTDSRRQAISDVIYDSYWLIVNDRLSLVSFAAFFGGRGVVIDDSSDDCWGITKGITPCLCVTTGGVVMTSRESVDRSFFCTRFSSVFCLRVVIRFLCDFGLWPVMVDG